MQSSVLKTNKLVALKADNQSIKKNNVYLVKFV